MKESLAMCAVGDEAYRVGLAMNRQQVVVTVPGQLGIAHLLSYLLVTHPLSPPPSYLPRRPAAASHLLDLWDMEIQLGWL